MSQDSRRPDQRRFPLRTQLLPALCLALAGLPSLAIGAADSGASTSRQEHRPGYSFAIARQPLVNALNAFSGVTGWQVGLPAELADGLVSPGVSGRLPARQALEQLLEGTGLVHRSIGERNVVLERQQFAGLELQPLTVSATRQAQSASLVPSSVSVKSREQLDRANVDDIRDLVRDEPGVSVGGTGQRSGTSGFNIRGIDGDRVLTQVDGVEVPNGFANGPYAKIERNYVDPEIVKRVEILRGPSSALYGSSAIGGAVSYFTLDADDILQEGRDQGARLKTGYASADDGWLNSATFAGRRDGFDGLLHLGRRDARETETAGSSGGVGLDRSRANPEDARSTSVLAKLGWSPSDGERLGLIYEHYRDEVDSDQKSAYGGPYFDGKPIISPDVLPGGMYQWRTGNDLIRRERFGLEHELGLESALADNVRWTLNHQEGETEQRTREFYHPLDRQMLRTRDTLYQERQWVFDLQLDKRFALGTSEHLLTYGGALRRQEVDGYRQGGGTCLAVGPRCPQVGFVRPGDGLVRSSDFPDPTIDTVALFAQDEIRWGDWTLLPGLRYDHTRLDPHITPEFLNTVRQANSAPVSDSSRTWHQLSPKFGLTYAAGQHYLWYGQYAEGFRTPSAKALYGRFENIGNSYRLEPNPNLDPERSRSLETGLRGTFESGNFDLALFYNRYRDLIDENASVPSSDELTFQTHNIARAEIKGMEFKGRLELEPFGAPTGLYANGSLAYAWGRDLDSGKALNSINPLTGVFGLGVDRDDYGALLNWTLARRKTRVDEQGFSAPDGTSEGFRPPGFGLLDLTGYYRISEGLTLNAGLFNLTDQKYWLWDDVRGFNGESSVLSPANLDRLTQPGRNVSVNLVWDI